MTREEIFNYVGRPDLANSDFDEWEFLAIFHPNYNCDNIAFNDDLERYLNGEYNPEDPEDNAARMAEAFPDRYDAEVEQLRLYCKEMLRAVNAYQSLRYPNGIIPY